MKKESTTNKMQIKKIPTVVLRSSRYQPTKAELDERVIIPATPEQLVKAVVRDVNIKFTGLKK